LTGPLRVVLRRFRRTTGIDLVKYSELVRLTVRVNNDTGFYTVGLEPRDGVFVEASELMQMTETVPESQVFDAQLKLLCNLYMAADIGLVASDTGERGIKIRKKIKQQNAKLLKLRTSVIESASCIKMDVEDKKGNQIPRASDVIPDCPATPAYIKELYGKYADQTGDTAPKQAMEGARLTGGTVDGVANALAALTKPRDNSVVDVNLMLASIYLMRMIQGWKGSTMFNPPRFYKGCFDKVLYDPTTGGGYHPGKMSTMESTSDPSDPFRVIFSNRVKRAELHETAMLLLDKINQLIRDNVEKGDYSFHRDIYPEVVNLIGIKVEAKGPDDDPNKNRIFFIPPHWYFILQKYCLGAAVEFQRRRGLSAHGLSWSRGDAQKFANMCKNMRKGYDFDVSGLDTSLLSSILMMVFSSYICFYKNTGTDYYIFRHHLTFIVEMTAYHIIQWPDGFWRFIFGTMFSGDYVTAPGDQDYVAACFIAWLIFNLKNPNLTAEMKEEIRESIQQWVKLATAWGETGIWIVEQLKLLFAAYGDDGMYTTNTDLLAAALPLSSMVDFFKSKCGLTVKYENCNEVTQFHSTLDKSGNLVKRKYVDPIGNVHMKPEGLHFLKRVFLKIDYKDLEITLPYRPTPDFYYRVGITPSDIQNPLLELFRIHGLMLDTLGTNVSAYEYLAKMADLLMEMKPWLSKELVDIKFANMGAYEDLRKMLKRYLYNGVMQDEYYDISRRPDFNKMCESICENTAYIARRKIGWMSLDVPIYYYPP